MAKHIVKCSICQQHFDANEVPFTKTSARRYAHTSCYEKKMNEMSQEEKDKIELENYIKQLFQIDTITPKIKKQLTIYINNYNYSYSGIKKALIYFYEVKGNSIEKANEGIGIVSYVYKQAFDYYYNLWLAKQKNENKNLSEYNSKVIEITIKPPQRKKKSKRFFSFLDREETENE